MKTTITAFVVQPETKEFHLWRKAIDILFIVPIGHGIELWDGFECEAEDSVLKLGDGQPHQAITLDTNYPSNVDDFEAVQRAFAADGWTIL